MSSQGVISSKEASNNPGLCPIKGQKSGLSSWTRAQNYLLSLSLCTDLSFSFYSTWRPPNQGAITVTWSKFHTEASQLLNTVAQNLVTTVTRHLGFVHPWFIPIYIGSDKYCSSLLWACSCYTNMSIQMQVESGCAMHILCDKQLNSYNTNHEARLNFVNCHLHGVYCGEIGTTLFLVNGETYFQLTSIRNFRIMSFLFQSRKCHCMALRLICVLL
jgi:hypothetical protein